MANSTATTSRDGAGAAQARKAVNITDLGTIDTTATISLAEAGIFKTDSVSGTITLTFADLAPGARATVLIKSAATAPTLTIAGVDVWFGAAAAPTYANSKTTLLELFNDGDRVCGRYVVQA